MAKGVKILKRDLEATPLQSADGQYQHTWLRFSSEFLFEKEDLDLYVPSSMVGTPTTSDLHAL